MARRESSSNPSWDFPLNLRLTPDALLKTVFGTAEDVHTGWDSCADPNLTVAETSATDPNSGNHCRLLELEYSYDTEPDINWRDWVVELRIDDVYVSAHWRAQNTEGPAAWDWCAAEAETAFSTACLLIGRRVRRTLVVDGASHQSPPPRDRQH